jgi:hypothetical protein
VDRPDRTGNRGDPGEEKKDVFTEAKMKIPSLFDFFADLPLDFKTSGVFKKAVSGDAAGTALRK